MTDGGPRLVILVSGTGSNLAAMLDASLPIVAVVADRDCRAIEVARAAGVAAIVVGDLTLLGDAVAAFEPDWVVLAGFLRLLKRPFVERFRVINLHPARPGELPGLYAIERALVEAQTGTRTHSGVMVHFVPDEGVDSGPVLATIDVAMEPLDTFATRMHLAEHELLVGALRNLLAEVSS